MQKVNKVLNSLPATLLPLISVILVLGFTLADQGAKCNSDKTCRSETTINITLPPLKIDKKKEDDDENQNEGDNKRNKS